MIHILKKKTPKLFLKDRFWTPKKQEAQGLHSLKKKPRENRPKGPSSFFITKSKRLGGESARQSR